MTINNRVVWREGLFLRPQHFQQHERAIERQLEIRASSLRAWGWGFTELELERDLLATGRVAVRRARGVLPDGTPFSMPDDDPVPPALEVSGATRDRTVFLALPLRRAGALDVGSPTKAASFDDSLSKGLREVNASVNRVDELPADLVSGRVGDFHELAVQIKQAELSFKFAMEVRNKLIDAYRETMRMSV